MTAGTIRTLRALAAAALGLALTAGSAPAAAADGEVRTESALGGYSIDATASPLLVLLDDPSVPIPRPPGGALLEADPSYTATTLSTGPQARALASTVWPGTLLGDGLNTATEGQSGDYPIKADARYPGGPQTDACCSLDPAQRQEPVPGSGAGMFATAKGLDVVAEARTGASPNPENLAVGQAQSRSGSTVVEGAGVASAQADVSDVSVMAGLIRVQNVRSTLESRSDGTTGSSSGTTTVTGLEIGGMGFVVDEQGVRPVQDGKPGAPPVPAVPADQALAELIAMGITVEPVSQAETLDGATVTRTAKGLRITVDTALFNAALRESPVPDALGPLFGQAPPELQGGLFYLLSATPKVTFVFASASVSSATSLPIVFDFPELGPFPLAPPALTNNAPNVLGGTFGPTGGVTAPPSLSAVGGAPPQVAESLRPVAAPRQPVEGFGGIAAGFVLLGLLGAAAGGRGLMGLRALALGGLPLGNGCALGAPGTVPDLRGA